MGRKVFAVASVVLVIGIAAWFFFGRDALTKKANGADVTSALVEATTQRTEETAEAAPAMPDDATTTMTLVGGDISLSYLDGFGLAVNQDQLLVSSSIPVCDEGFDYCIYLDSGEYDGTNFDGAGLRIEVRDDLDYEAACMLEQPNGYAGLEPVLQGGRDHVTAMFDKIGEGAAGHFTNGAVYRLYFAGTCYGFESRVGQTQFANFEPGVIDRFEDSDLAALQARLAAIMDSVSLPDGRDALWTRDDDPETLVADVRVRGLEPPADSTVSSPLELAGEAMGSWFFEGTFPYRLQTADGDVLASGAVKADGDWMTTEFVPFSATIEYDVAAETAATLVLMNDNPSGLSENDESLAVPLTLRP